VVNHLRSAETPDQRPRAPAAAPSARQSSSRC